MGAELDKPQVEDTREAEGAVDAAVEGAVDAANDAADDDANDAAADDAQLPLPGPPGEAATAPVEPAAAPEPNGAPEPAADDDDDIYKVSIDGFEGPLDLLLHLIRKHELDILDIPISFITSKYLEYLELMREVHIDVASEYLVMAATLAHIKSKTLLPPEPGDEDDDGELEEMDPREELVRRLLEYQKYKNVAGQLATRAAMGRDTFTRGTSEPEEEGLAPLAPVNVFKLFDAFEKVLKRSDQKTDHQVLFERISLSERIVELTEVLSDRRRMHFKQLFEDKDGKIPSRGDLIITFLAVLELCKMRVIRVTQDDPLEELMLEFAPKRLEGDAVPLPEEGDEQAEADEVEPDTDAESGPASGADSDSGTESESDSGSESGADSGAGSESDSNSDSESEADSDAGFESDSEADSDAGPESDSEADSDADAESTTAP
jgi:segregation and condensation protein A